MKNAPSRERGKPGATPLFKNKDIRFMQE